MRVQIIHVPYTCGVKDCMEPPRVLLIPDGESKRKACYCIIHWSEFLDTHPDIYDDPSRIIVPEST